jgi:hypothetical protein
MAPASNRHIGSSRLTGVAFILSIEMACNVGGEVIAPESSEAGAAGVATSGAAPPTSLAGAGAAAAAGTGVAAGGASGASGVVGTAGLAGSPASGGTAGAGGAAGIAGGETQPLDQVPGELGTFRFEMPCAFAHDNVNSPLPAQCASTRDVCNVVGDGNGQHATRIVPIRIGGDPNLVYEFSLRIRGVIEPKQYPGATQLFGTPKVTPLFVGLGGQPDTTQFNIWRLTIADPPQTLYLNDALNSPSHRVEIIDGQFPVQARGQTKVEFYFDDLNTGQIRNCTQYTVPDIPPYPSFFDGNFFQLDLVPGSVRVIH